METYDENDERDLGFGHSDPNHDPYLTGNDTDAPDSRDVLAQDGLTITDTSIPAEDQEQTPVPGQGDSFVGLGGATGTEDFDQDPRDGTGRPHDQAEIGDADFRTQQAVFQQWQQNAEDQNLP